MQAYEYTPGTIYSPVIHQIYPVGQAQDPHCYSFKGSKIPTKTTHLNAIPKNNTNVFKGCLWGLAGLTTMVAIPPLLGFTLITGGAALLTAAFGSFKVALALGIECLLSAIAARIAYKISYEFFRKAVVS